MCVCVCLVEHIITLIKTEEGRNRYLEGKQWSVFRALDTVNSHRTKLNIEKPTSVVPWSEEAA